MVFIGCLLDTWGVYRQVERHPACLFIKSVSGGQAMAELWLVSIKNIPDLQVHSVLRSASRHFTRELILKSGGWPYFDYNTLCPARVQWEVEVSGAGTTSSGVRTQQLSTGEIHPHGWPGLELPSGFEPWIAHCCKRCCRPTATQYRRQV